MLNFTAFLIYRGDATIPDGKVTPSNYNQIRDRVAAELRNNPEKWIQPV
ncbi:MAG: hypothetical protein QXU18_11010 [Thermoplasmatales archaeon]